MSTARLWLTSCSWSNRARVNNMLHVESRRVLTEATGTGRGHGLLSSNGARSIHWHQHWHWLNLMLDRSLTSDWWLMVERWTTRRIRQSCQCRNNAIINAVVHIEFLGTFDEDKSFLITVWLWLSLKPLPLARDHRKCTKDAVQRLDSTTRIGGVAISRADITSLYQSRVENSTDTLKGNLKWGLTLYVEVELE